MRGWIPSKLTRAQQEERRLAALAWIQAGTHTNQAIADHFGVSVHTVYTWKERLKNRGNLDATVAQGRTPFLTEAQREQVRTLLRAGPLTYDFPDDTWTTPHKGAQGLWTIKADALARVRALWKEARQGRAA